VDYTAFVGIVECASDLDYDLGCAGGGQWAFPGNEIPKRFTFNEGHSQIVDIFLLAYVIDTDDVRMTQLGHRPGLA
jgi:hypothetical protein